MAFWLFVVVSSFLFLFVATQKVTVLNVTCLWLIGIWLRNGSWRCDH
ncbi:MAG TPA: hypothetical protein VK673_20490 [Chthoniobacterales bacterium]|nr:hypothetical protein [Chthoniobacterales bacterium]